MSWYIEAGPHHDVVLSSRIRLARNFSGLPFKKRADRSTSMKVLDKAKKLFKGMLYIDISEINVIERQALVERHLISPELASGKNNPAVFVSKDESISIMVNEEDHLRIQSMQAGLQLESALEKAISIDEEIAEKEEYAFRHDYGYLTGCPTNLGTGMRASVMMHLPAMTKTGVMERTLEACSKLGIAIRGLYGEHSNASGYIFQISNQISLGQSEDEIVANVKSIVEQLIDTEKKLRKELLEKDRIGFEDEVFRALGAFSNARIISSEECLKLMSDIRLGISAGLLKQPGIEAINELMLMTRAATLQKSAGRPLEARERDIYRADIIRKKLERG